MNKSNIAEARISATTRTRFGHVLGSITFERFYRVWSLVHSAVIVLLVVLAEFPETRAIAMSLLAGWLVVALGGLILVAWAIHPDGSGPALPNVLTGTRLLAAFLFLGLMVISSWYPEVADAARSGAGWFLVAGLLIVETTDFFDGRIARRLNAGAFGAIWDMENDVAYAAAITIALRHLHGIGIFVLAIGLIRPLYVLLWHYETEPVNPPKTYKLFAKTVAATQVTTMIVAMVPILPHAVRTAALVLVLSLQLVSFGWDLVLQRRSAAQQRG
jgi:phosphatidylglycerophosphate synthase